MDKALEKKWQLKTVKAFDNANIVITQEEKEKIEIVDFGLKCFEKYGLSILTYVNTKKVCAKEMVLLPGQICPEHRHPNVNGVMGKEETFRCRKGKVSLYVPADNHESISKPKNLPSDSVFTVFKEIVLNEGEQYTIYPNTLHWFKGGEEGAIVSEFSTKSMDDFDIFSDPLIKRV